MYTWKEKEAKNLSAFLSSLVFFVLVLLSEDWEAGGFVPTFITTRSLFFHDLDSTTNERLLLQDEDPSAAEKEKVKARWSPGLRDCGLRKRILSHALLFLRSYPNGFAKTFVRKTKNSKEWKKALIITILLCFVCRHLFLLVAADGEVNYNIFHIPEYSEE